MAYEAKVFRVLIASPSDVIEEREIAVKTIQEWNDLNSSERQIVLLPLRWETHTAPEYGKRPQEVINRQMVDHCDLLIGVFWTRIGSPTGVSDSGTLEEIDEAASSGKPVMLYFSKIKKDPDEIEVEQLVHLRDFKNKTYPKALVENFSSQIEFRDKLSKQIELQLRTLLTDSNGNFTGKIASEIDFEFSNAETGENLGTSLKRDCTFLNINNYDNVPDYEDTIERKVTTRAADGRVREISFGGNRDNKDFYREVVDYAVAEKMFTPIDFWLKNKGSLGAKDLYVDIKLESDTSSLVVLKAAEFNVKKPIKTKAELYPSFKSLYYEDISVKKVEGRLNEWELSFELNALQPKREICPDTVIYIGAKESCTVSFHVTIYADSLPEPICHNLTVELSVESVEIDAVQMLRDSGQFDSLKSA
ncbi:TPA: hypothetical protein ACGVBV_004335 [Vibrio vulnificus]